jgi:enoyl-CoA hydratase
MRTQPIQARTKRALTVRRPSMSFTSDVISIERNGAIGTLWLDRPNKHNALNMEFWRLLPQALDELANDDNIRAVILAGKGPSFTVGLDLVEMASNTMSAEKPASRAAGNLAQIKLTSSMQRTISAFADCRLPVIAAIHGMCLGAGIDLITACDVRLAAAGSTFSIRETRVGIIADVGTLQRLPAIVGAGHVAELAYTGKDIDTERACEIGLVNSRYADFEATYKAAQEMAQEISANSPLAVQGTKFMLQQGENLTTEQSLLLNGMYTMMTSLQSNDMQEAMAAFMEKRPPSFTGT